MSKKKHCGWFGRSSPLLTAAKMLRVGQQALQRGLATMAGAEAHSGLVELRQYQLKPEGIKVRMIRHNAPRQAPKPHAAAAASAARRPPRRSLPSQLSYYPTVQEFMRLTKDKVELRKSLLPFLGCVPCMAIQACPALLPPRHSAACSPRTPLSLPPPSPSQYVYVRHWRPAEPRGAPVPLSGL